MTQGVKELVSPSIQGLPDDILFLIFKKCQLSDLGRLAQTCKGFNVLIKRDTVWVEHLKPLTAVFSTGKRCLKAKFKFYSEFTFNSNLLRNQQNTTIYL